jgi:Spy/CpxP family protein refolding chaperone
MITNWKVIVATMVIFCTGFFAGVLFPRHVKSTSNSPQSTSAQSVPLPNERRIEALRRFTQDLQLTEEQRQKIEAHISESQDRTRVLWDLVGPEVQDEFKRLRGAVVQELTSSQRRQFEERSRRYRKERSSTKAETNAVALP